MNRLRVYLYWDRCGAWASPYNTKNEEGGLHPTLFLSIIIADRGAVENVPNLHTVAFLLGSGVGSSWGRLGSKVASVPEPPYCR